MNNMYGETKMGVQDLEATAIRDLKPVFHVNPFLGTSAKELEKMPTSTKKKKQSFACLNI